MFITSIVSKISVGKEGQKFRINWCVECHNVALVSFLWVASTDISILLFSYLDLDGELFVILFLMFTLFVYFTAEMPNSLRCLRAIRQKYLSLHFIFSNSFGPRLLLALRTLPDVSESSWSLVEFGLAFIGNFSADLFRSDEWGGWIIFVIEK